MFQDASRKKPNRGSRMTRLGEHLGVADWLKDLPQDGVMAEAIAQVIAEKLAWEARIAAGEQLRPWAEESYRRLHSGELERGVSPDGQPWCDHCRGLRFLARRYDSIGADGKPIWLDRADPDFGKLVPCLHCSDRDRTAQAEDVVKWLKFTDQERSRTFATLKCPPMDREILKAVWEWARSPQGSICFHGGVGSGKTHVALAVANQRASQGKKSFFRYTPDLVREAKHALHNDHQRLEEIEEILCSGMPVILDDLGAARSTEWALGEFLEPLFDVRYRKNLPTFVTCIGGPEGIKDPQIGLSENIGRRMQDPDIYTVLHNEAPQYKLAVAQGERRG